MPQPFSNRHNGFLRNYITTGKAKILNTVREVRRVWVCLCVYLWGRGGRGGLDGVVGKQQDQVGHLQGPSPEL